MGQHTTDTLPTRWLTHYRHVGWHTTDTLADTLPTRRLTHYQHVDRHTTDAFIEKLTFPNSYFVTSFSLKQEQHHKKGGKHTNAFIEKLTFPNSYLVTSFSRKQEQCHRKWGLLDVFFKGRLPKGVGRQVNHVYLFSSHDSEVKTLIDRCSFFLPNGVGRHILYMFIYVKILYWSLTFRYVVAPKGAVFCFFAVLLQWKLFSNVFQQLLECSVFSEVSEPGELVQVAGYVFIQRTRHRLQLLLDQSPHAFNGIGVCTTVRPSETLPLLYFLLAPNFDSSISTVFPKPPSLIPAFRTLLEQIVLSSLSAWITVGFERLESRAILLPEICIAQRNIRCSQVLNGILDPSKKEPDLIESQVRHRLFVQQFSLGKVCNNQLGKAYQDLKAQFDELEVSCQEREEQLAQAQQDADEMADTLAGTARSTIRDFLGIAELQIVNEVTYQSTLERLGDPKLSVKRIEQECRRQLGGLLPLVKRLRVAKKLLPLALEDAFYS